MTTALTLFIAFVGGLAAYATWALSAYRQGADAALLAVGAVLLYLAVFLVVTGVWFALAWVFRVRRPADMRLGIGGSVELFWSEWLTLLGSGLRMGFGWWFMREPKPGRADAPVLLIHGVLCNAGVWQGMRGALCRLGLGPLYTISYGPPLASIETFAEQLAHKIDTIVADTGAGRVVLVGHSMGGLVARAYLRRYGASRTARLVTIGTPHAGSVHAWLFPGTSLAQLRPGSQWLQALNASPMPALPITCIWSWHDSMVAPQDSARLPGAHNVAVVGVGHNALLRDAKVTRLVAAELVAARGGEFSSATVAAGRTARRADG